jgi:hypothetical protein
MENQASHPSIISESSVPTVQTVVTALPVATASLYLLGESFYEGYLRELRIEETLFPLTVDEKLFYGVISFVELGISQVLNFILATEVIAGVALVIVALSTSSKWRSYLKLSSFKFSRRKSRTAQITPPRGLVKFADFSIKVFVFSVAILFIILGVVFAGYLSEKAGENNAKNYLKKIRQGKVNPVDLYLVGELLPSKAYPIMCSSTHCSFLIGNKAVIYRHDQIQKTVATGVSTD